MSTDRYCDNRPRRPLQLQASWTVRSYFSRSHEYDVILAFPNRRDIENAAFWRTRLPEVSILTRATSAIRSYSFAIALNRRNVELPGQRPVAASINTAAEYGRLPLYGLPI